MSTTEPGSDWADVPECTRYTPEQAARKFLTLEWDEQVARMESLLAAADEALTCRILDHDSALTFARTHTCRTLEDHQCPPDRYQQGWQDGLTELERQIGASH